MFPRRFLLPVCHLLIAGLTIGLASVRTRDAGALTVPGTAQTISTCARTLGGLYAARTHYLTQSTRAEHPSFSTCPALDLFQDQSVSLWRPGGMLVDANSTVYVTRLKDRAPPFLI